MHVSATTDAIPSATNLTTLGIAANRRHCQTPSARQEDRSLQTPPRASTAAPRIARRTRSLQTRGRRMVARLKQRFVMGPWIAADQS